MAIPQADFDRLVDSVKEEVIEAVREEIAKLPYGGPLCQDTKIGFAKSYFPPFSEMILSTIGRGLS